MTTKAWRAIVLLSLLLALLLAGCAAESYRGPSSTGAYRGELPPALRDTDPALRDWYSRDYFNPYEMP